MCKFNTETKSETTILKSQGAAVRCAGTGRSLAAGSGSTADHPVKSEGGRYKSSQK
jgi:hypothetical protein